MSTKQETTADRNALGPVKIGIILTAVATALIHFSLLFPDVMFILNGLGYLTLLALYFFAGKYQGTVRWLFIGYTAVTVLAWVFIGSRSTLAYIDKAIEVALIALLWVDRDK